jgi:hypothetical protein
MLHFGREQLFWECLTMAECEVTPEMRTPGFKNQGKTANFKFDDDGKVLWGKEHSNTSESGHGAALMWYQWDKIVKQYSAANLTFEDDKLVAISGLARILQDRLNVEYIAGL